MLLYVFRLKRRQFLLNNITFVTNNNNNFYKLELLKTLLHFVEYDFTYFWEQCIDLGKKSRKSGGSPTKQFSIIRNLIIKCHPYFEAQMNADFEFIVLDCIIEYICHSENIGLEELWARCISPKNLYEKSIFTRISEYKTNRAINQWANIMRIQDYARKKMEFIFGGDPANQTLYRARKGYFDLTFTVAAKELGFESSALPSVKCYNSSLMPNSAFMISKVSKGILRRISETIDTAVEPYYNKVNNCLRDQIGLDAFSYVNTLPRPPEYEMVAASEIFDSISKTVYLPDSFKAIIDLEFDKILEEEMALQKCEKCGKFFQQEMSYIGKYCNRVNASGLTCREQIENENGPLEPIDTQLDTRCKHIYESLSLRVGDEFKENEFKEWSQYLANMKENVKNEYSSVEDLEAFLDYSEKMYSDVKQSQREARASVPSEPKIPKTPEISPLPNHMPSVENAPKPYHFPTLEELDG